MDDAEAAGQDTVQITGVEFAVATGQGCQFCAAGKGFGGIGLVHRDMGLFVAQDGPPRRAVGGKGKGIGGGSRRHGQAGEVMIEQGGKARLKGGRDRVGAI